jgi:hypothetical protein
VLTGTNEHELWGNPPSADEYRLLGVLDGVGQRLKILGTIDEEIYLVIVANGSKTVITVLLLLFFVVL